MLVLIDNYDSFTFNLAQALGELGADVRVFRNDAVTRDQIDALRPSHLVISPGPGHPEASGVSMEVIRTFGASVPTLGVCLGHQAIGASFGARVDRAPKPVHGKTSAIVHDGLGVFRGLPQGIRVGRYHSLVVRHDERWPVDLDVAATTDDRLLVMGLRHRSWPLHGVQFHPESILTDEGRQILQNFLELR